MTSLGVVFRNVIRGATLYSFMQDVTRQGVHSKLIYQRIPFRTLCLSNSLRKEETKTQELDLDGWKAVTKSASPEANEESVPEGKEDSSLTAMRELVEMWKLSGKTVPENLTDNQLNVLMELSTKSARKKYLKFLAIKEAIKKSKKEKKEKLKEIMEKEPVCPVEKEEESGPKNSIFRQVWQKTMDNAYNARAAQSMMFGQPIVFDMAYSNHMSQRELLNTVTQLMESEGWNRRSPDPFHIHFCNFQRDGAYHKELIKRYQDAWDRLFVTATEKSYMDVFPINELVYLTADSPNVMKKFEHDKVYIIGSLVDKSQQTGLSLAVAKRLKLPTLRLPLERYLQWDSGGKNLTLDQMIRILLTLKETADWEKALAFVPKRKHDGFVDISKYNIDNLQRNKGYEFGTVKKNVAKLSAKKSSLKPNQKKWWEEDL